MIPLILKIKKQAHKDIALAQDILINEVYKIFTRAVLHGGTAIWRCYSGNRFSEDIDICIPKDREKLGILFKELEKLGFTIEKKKIGERSLFSSLSINRVIVRLEAIFKEQKGILKEYATAEGNLITIYTLTAEELIKEKTNAYLKRGKIRDLYDIFFLLRYIKNKDEIANSLKNLIKNFKKPVDESELASLVIEGLIPKTDEMIKYIERFI